MNAHPRPWELATGAIYRITADDLDHEGKNKLGIKVGLPLDTPLCGFCDAPLTSAACAACETIHCDFDDGATECGLCNSALVDGECECCGGPERLTEVHGDPFLKRSAA